MLFITHNRSKATAEPHEHKGDLYAQVDAGAVRANRQGCCGGPGKVTNVRVGDFSVVADIVSRSGKSAYQ